MAAFAFPMTFINTMNGFTIFMALWGVGFGGFWTFMGPAMADIVDEIVIKDKRRDDGVLMGIRAFFMRFSYASQAIVFYLVHTLTRFEANPTSDSAAFWYITSYGCNSCLIFLGGCIPLY